MNSQSPTCEPDSDVHHNCLEAFHGCSCTFHSLTCAPLAIRRKQRDPLSHSAPPTARFPSAPSLTGRTRVPSEDSFAASSMNEIGTGRRLAREVERKLIWYQDAIHEQELQSQLLEQKVMALQSQVQEMLEYQKQHPGLPGVGLAEMEKEMRRREKRELGRLSRNLQASN